MSKLAILGHPERGEEVIQILEMLVGINKEEHNGENNRLWYSIDERNEINFFTHAFDLNDYFFFTIEEFLEKFPYKVGDKVNYPCKGCIKTITSMEWDTYLNAVTYKLDNRIYTNIDQLKVFERFTILKRRNYGRKN